MDPRTERDAREEGTAKAQTDGADVDELLVLPDLSGLSVAGITRRRVAFLAACFLSVWIVILFARQVGQASEATARLHELQAGNIARAQQVASLHRELGLIQRQEYIEQAARAYGLGTGDEIPFAIRRKEPLPPNAPGSASVRLGATPETVSPLESWLSLLFGPSR